MLGLVIVISSILGAETASPKDVIRCYGLVETKEAANRNFTPQAESIPCDPNGYILLLRGDCELIPRGTRKNMTEMGCPGRPCKTKVDKCIPHPALAVAIKRHSERRNKKGGDSNKPNPFKVTKRPGVRISSY